MSRKDSVGYSVCDHNEWVSVEMVFVLVSETGPVTGDIEV